MKTSKKLIVMLLVLILGIAAFVPSTFSWYDHKDSQTGNRMTYSRNDLPVSAGTISLVTKKYRMDGNNVYYDQKGNKEYDGGAISSGSVAKETNQYYGTTITNTGSAPAYVNLYLKNFTNDPNNYIGTLQPSLTHKNLSSSVHLTNKNFIRVYVQVGNANNWKDSNAKTYLVYKTKTNSNYQYKQITNNINIASDTGNILNGVATRYVDLADNTTEFFFATDGNDGGFNTSNCTVTQPWYRTKTITNVQAETGYYLTGVADDTTFNAQYATFAIPGGVSVNTYFDTATINKNQHAYVTLTKGTNYTGASASYEISGNNISINGNTGYITAGSSFNNGSTATVTTTITGSLGDTTTVTTAITNPALMPSAAVALNVEIPGRHTDEEGKTVDGTAEIVWYIQNTSSNTCSFSGIYYTK